MKQPPITAFHWRQTPCLLLREFASHSAFVADPKKRGREKIVVDVAGMVQMRREGRGWRDIAQRFDCNKETARQRVGQVAPELLLPMPKKEPRPVNQIVILSRKETDRTNAIRGRV